MMPRAVVTGGQKRLVLGVNLSKKKRNLQVPKLSIVHSKKLSKTIVIQSIFFKNQN